MRIRIVVADQAEARFFDALSFARPPRFTGALTNPIAHLRDQDLTSDRPGRVFNSSATPGRRRGATTRHSTGGESTPRRHATHLFARRVAAELDRGRRAGSFERLVMVAAPAFLGELRLALPAALRPLVGATVAKDIVHHAEQDVRRYLTRAMFNAPIGFAQMPALASASSRRRRVSASAG